jgi:transcription termination factor Rho
MADKKTQKTSSVDKSSLDKTVLDKSATELVEETVLADNNGHDDQETQPTDDKSDSKQTESVDTNSEPTKADIVMPNTSMPERRSVQSQTSRQGVVNNQRPLVMNPGFARNGQARFQPRPMAPRMPMRPTEPVEAVKVRGIIEMTGNDGRGILRPEIKAGDMDVFVPSQVSRTARLRPGDMVEGLARKSRPGEPYMGMVQVVTVNGIDVANSFDRPRFERGTPIYPQERLTLETGKEIISTRVIDLVAPIGKGQRGLIVSPPKAGKTTVIKEIASGVAVNYGDVHLMAVLVGERPEEVTDISRHIVEITKGSKMTGETFASNFDEKPEEQTRVSELALERAKRLVELGGDVVIVLDSITRLARAYNLAIPTSGRTLSGGFDPAALYPPKKFFGAARKIEGGGSLTIIGTALVDTGSKMDDLVYEEFKGTGNMELHLDRRLAERRIYPAIDVLRSGTRRDDLLFDSMEYQSVILMRRMLDILNDGERTEVVLSRMQKTKNNKEFLASLKDG